MERRLSAIFAADLVGYSRLMEADEVGTLERQKAHRREFINPTFETFHGRIVKEMGDGLLVEFPSVVEAVQCAVAIQRAMPEREADVAEDRRITYRVGINLGDIIVEGDDIHGDGVNVAARLEAMAKPGGICISGAAYDQLRSTVEVGYESLGEVQVKNIERPIRVYRVLTEAVDAGTLIEKPRRRLEPRLWAAIAAVLLLAIGAAGWWAQQPDFEPVDPGTMALKLPDGPSIAVLPFDYLGPGKEENEYLADGLSEYITAHLTQIPNLFVIARNSAFTYKGKAVDVREVSRNFGVRHVLEGSVQRAGGSLRITAQLIDAVEGKNVWAETYDRPVDDYFAIQDEITIAVMEVTYGETIGGDYSKRGRTDNLAAYAEFIKAESGRLATTAEMIGKTHRHYMNALELDPDFAGAWSGLSMRFLMAAERLKGDTFIGAIAEAEGHLKKAMELDPGDPISMSRLSGVRMWQGRPEEAVRLARDAVDKAPQDATMNLGLAIRLMYVGKPEEAIPYFEKSKRLQPVTPILLSGLYGICLIDADEYDKAIAVVDASLSDVPSGRRHLWLAFTAIAHWLDNDKESAKLKLAEVFDAKSDFSRLDLILLARSYADKSKPERWFQALREMGVPDHPPPKLPDKPSIAVLPFDNMSDDQSQQFFVDGMVEDLITDLSKVPGLFVIARNSSFAYRDRSVDVKQVARELGVQHVLEGSVRRVGDRVRINAQLIDGLTNSHVWAERYDGKLDDVFDLQDQITSEIVHALQLQLSPQKRKQLASAKTRNTDAYDHFLKGREHRHLLNPEAYKAAIEHLSKAVDIDADYAQAHGELAFLYWDSLQRGWLQNIGVQGDREAIRHATHHLDLALRDPTPIAYITRGFMIGIVERDADRALKTARRAIEVDPNFSEGHVLVAERAALADEADEALRLLEVAQRLDPSLPPGFHFAEGLAHYVSKDYGAARSALEMELELRADNGYAQLLLIAVYGQFGEAERAANMIATYNQGFRSAGFVSMVAGAAYLWPFKHADTNNRMYEDFKKAGLADPEPAFGKDAIERELTAEEAWSLCSPSEASGVMVAPSGDKVPFSWRQQADGQMEFSMSGQVYRVQNHRTGDVYWNERGKHRVFRLTDAEAQKWLHQYVTYQQSTDSYFYFTPLR